MAEGPFSGIQDLFSVPLTSWGSTRLCVPDDKGNDMARPRATLLGLGLVVALVTSACGGSGAPSSSKQSTTPATMPAGPSCIKPDSGKGCLPTAPTDKRVDLVRPSFSNPTSITNPLHPSSKVSQVIYGGQVDDKPFRTEFTRLPVTKSITWNGQQIDTVTWQYLAYSAGRIQEIALDWFAQADDGAVWYLGEDVADFKNGVIYTHEGTWLAGKDGPGAMIMPADPKVGNVYRTENAPGIVFEEITVKAVGQTVPGPSGPVSGALIVSELHTDGTREDKIFAPGYGEFSTGDPTGDLEQASLAVPTDMQQEPPPAGLTALHTAVRTAFDRVGSNDWSGAAAADASLRKTWDAYRATGVPAILDKQMTRDIETLDAAVAARKPTEAHAAVLRVAQNDLDLDLRHRPVVKVDLARLRLWTRQVQVDAAANDAGAVAGDVATLELVRDRVRHTLDQATAARLDAQLRDLHAAAGRKDTADAAKATPALLATLATM
jgi:hypothetical protein